MQGARTVADQKIEPYLCVPVNLGIMKCKRASARHRVVAKGFFPVLSAKVGRTLPVREEQTFRRRQSVTNTPVQRRDRQIWGRLWGNDWHLILAAVSESYEGGHR